MRTKKGIVTSDARKDEGTIVVSVYTYKSHPKYKKRHRVTKKFHADTNGKEVTLGDQVVIEECRPLSKLKHWKLIEVTGNHGSSVDYTSELRQ